MDKLNPLLLNEKTAEAALQNQKSIWAERRDWFDVLKQKEAKLKALEDAEGSWHVLILCKMVADFAFLVCRSSKTSNGRESEREKTSSGRESESERRSAARKPEA